MLHHYLSRKGRSGTNRRGLFDYLIWQRKIIRNLKSEASERSFDLLLQRLVIVVHGVVGEGRLKGPRGLKRVAALGRLGF